MTIDVYERHAAPALIDRIAKISKTPQGWGVINIRRNYLRTTTNEAFMLVLRPALIEAPEAYVYFVDDKNIYVVWRDHVQKIFRLTRATIGNSLVRAGLDINPSIIVTYFDAPQQGGTLLAMLRADYPPVPHSADQEMRFNPSQNTEDEDLMMIDNAAPLLHASGEQILRYHDMRNQKIHRKYLSLLVVEDQVFTQRLLCEILRGIRLRNNNESPIIESTGTLGEGWRIFLKKAPDICFIDLNLLDGSGHMLARAIKEVDPGARVAIVTANAFDEEMSVAQENNVDHFIAKPFNKQRILNCVNHYIETSKGPSRVGFADCR